MSLQDIIEHLALPVIASPLFIVSNPQLVIAECCNGIIGSIPSLNARQKEDFPLMLATIEEGIQKAVSTGKCRKAAPYAVNLIVHSSNDRLDHDLGVCVDHKVPVVITSLHAPGKVVEAVHNYGGVVLHDVISIRHAKKALNEGVDGLIAVCSGAGGHGGSLSPFALIGEIRRFYDGVIVLSGAISRGDDILAVQAMGANAAYIGTRFIATPEANAVDEYKEMIIQSDASGIVYTPFFTGVNGNYLRESIVRSGLDPDDLKNGLSANFGSTRVKPWKNIWGAGQGVGNIDEILPASEVIAKLKREYRAAFHRLQNKGAIYVR